MKKLSIAVLTLVAASSVFASSVVKRGAPLSDGKPVAIETVIKTPADYTAKPIIVEGLIERSCTNQGCWMQISPSAEKSGLRVTFKDGKFTIPLNAKGMSARAEGVATIKVLSKDEADHLGSEGAKLARNADGSANEVAFEAVGVELRKAD